MKSSKLRPLPLRCDPIEGESLNGFVQRLAERNGITARSLLSFDDVRDPFTVSTDPSTLRGLAILADRDPQQFPAMGGLASDPSTVDDNGYRSTAILGKVVSAGYERRQLKAVCPGCLAESPQYHRLEWEFLFVGACHVHRCALLTRCPGCDEWLDWNRTDLARCRCDMAWQNVKPEVWDDARLAGTRFLASRFHGLGNDPEPEAVAALPLIHAIDFLLALGALASNGKPWGLGAYARDMHLAGYLNDGLGFAAMPPSSLSRLMNNLEGHLVRQPTMRAEMLRWCDRIEPHGSAATSAVLDRIRQTVRARAGEAQRSFGF